jgi:hypothetical protein
MAARKSLASLARDGWRRRGKEGNQRERVAPTDGSRMSQARGWQA